MKHNSTCHAGLRYGTSLDESALLIWLAVIFIHCILGTFAVNSTIWCFKPCCHPQPSQPSQLCPSIWWPSSGDDAIGGRTKSQQRKIALEGVSPRWVTTNFHWLGLCSLGLKGSPQASPPFKRIPSFQSTCRQTIKSICGVMCISMIIITCIHNMSSAWNVGPWSNSSYRYMYILIYTHTLITLKDLYNLLEPRDNPKAAPPQKNVEEFFAPNKLAPPRLAQAGFGASKSTGPPFAGHHRKPWFFTSDDVWLRQRPHPDFDT